MNRVLITSIFIVTFTLFAFVTKFDTLYSTESGNRDDKQSAPKAPLFDNLGSHHHPITTNSKLAQRYFDQGLILSYAFNHAEAIRSFREATKLDPDCAMCYWGIALAYGPNINAGMDKEAVPKAYKALQKAIRFSDKVSEKEQSYIKALAKRYTKEPISDREPLDIAYANAMRELVKRYPNDLDASTLFAEALMDTMPWDYWKKDGEPKPETTEVLSTLESVLKRNPDHIGANHLYIHVVEASPNPERGLPSAYRLQDLTPGAGHLVHMPSHIYIRVGRYHDASLANQRAIEADKAYLARLEAEGVYPLAYVPHNYHFLWATTTMEGRSATAIKAARELASDIDKEDMRKPGLGTLQHYYVTPLYALTRFGKWEEILREPKPAQDLKYPTGVWHYARGIAFTRKGELKKAEAELNKLKEIAADRSLEDVTIWDINKVSDLLKIASEVLAGELAAEREDYEKATNHLRMGIRLEDELNYDEPPPWYYPVRQSLGAVLLEAGQVKEAEKVYYEDLKNFPKNGWSLYGLLQSLRIQGKTKEAKKVQKDFEEVWKHADVILTASRF